MRKSIQTALRAVCSLLALGVAPIQAAKCDRACLEQLIDDYLTALVAHDPSSLPTAPCVTYVENSQFLPLGSGEWKVAGGLGKYRHTFSDPEAQQVGTITTLTENGIGIIYIVRLRINDDGMITEIESQITRDSTGAQRYENMTTPEAVWLEPVPLEERISRARLIEQTNKYYSGMEGNDPKGDYSFFHKDCNRLEDGLQTTNQPNGDPYGHSNDTSFASLGCEEQFQTGFLGFVTKIRDRRYPIVDEERQAVLAIPIFDHNGTVRSLPSVNGTSSPIPPYFDVPRTLAASEGFRLKGDKLFRIEMTLTEVPYGMRSAFDADGPPIDSPWLGNESTSNPCERDCFDIILIDQVLSALLTHNASKLPLAKGARYSENGQFLAFDNGLWLTLQQAAMPWETAKHGARPSEFDYAARYIDAASGTLGYYGLIREQTTKGVLMLRIKISDSKITEIEAIAIRAEFDGERGGTKTLMRPPLPVEWDGSSLGRLDPAFMRNTTIPEAVPSSLINVYFDSLQQHSAANAPFATSCTRRDNGVLRNTTCSEQIEGMGETPNGLMNTTTTVRDRRVLVSDESKGVALVVAMVDHPAVGASPSPKSRAVPGTYMITQLIKVEKGSIVKVEGLIKWMPLGYVSAWSEIEGNGGQDGSQKSQNCSADL